MIIRWPEWKPDLPDFGSDGSPRLRNVMPATPISYGPVGTPVPHSSNTLDERCQGSYSIRAPDGSVYIFAGDRQKLYMLPPSSLALADASRTTGGAYATPTVPLNGGHWAMTSFGDRVIATNGIDEVQSLILGGGGAHFEALQPGDPGIPDPDPPDPVVPPTEPAPRARFVATVKDFLFLAHVPGVHPQRVMWSGINRPDHWPIPGSIDALASQSDYQELQQTDLGQITGLVPGFSPGSDVAIFCERGIWTGAYAGPPILFNFRVAQGASGTLSPLSLVRAHARDNTGALRPVIYYLGSEGFAAFDGSASLPIGALKFDKAFFREIDSTYLAYVTGTADPRTHTVTWAFPSIGGNGLHDRLLTYNWVLGRATLSELDPAQYLEWLTMAMYGTAYTLDNIDGFGDLEIIQPTLDDAFWSGNFSGALSAFTADHRLAIANGPPLAPLLETGEMQPAEGRRSWVELVRPLLDVGAAQVSVGHRERLDAPVVWEAPVLVNQLGECPQRATGRYVRFRMTLPAGTYFGALQGIEIMMRPDARLR